MKKIILFVCVSCLFILSNIYAQDDFDDCFEVERLKAKSEGANTEDSINQAKEICNIKLNTGDDASESQNNPDFSEAEEVLFGKNTPETPGFTINFFNGNKEISGVSDSGLTTKGFLFTIPVSSRFSLTAGYLLSEGQISFTQTVAETYTETYVSGSTTSSQREMDPRPTYVGDAGDPGDEDSSRYYGSFCAFFRDWDSDGSLSSRDDCYGFATAREYALESQKFLLVVMKKIFMYLLSHIIIVLIMEIICLHLVFLHLVILVILNVICIQLFQEAAREQIA